ncbi:HECT domain-containing protein [Madurella fahalii]|uniref:HECT-type E3 ubiquitin transferase n=1 Tax=Madurella fahalii TaxID=1157608 RepID=A0ABQ0GD96_9PEZI
MTRDAMRPSSAEHQSYGHADDLDVLAGLWEEARFARLPWDAPSELKDLVEDIDNPKRVYAVHKASRRHNFQLLVQKYMIQLREGCGAEHCSTPTCFTCRKRIVGRAPIRRYNTTSARTLATYLASQDNPENGLCPGLRPPKTPPAALNSLVFVPNPKPRLRDDRATATLPKAQAVHSRPVSPKGVAGNGVRPLSMRNCSATVHENDREKSGPGNPRSGPDAPKQPQHPDFTIVEEPVSKDHRSFAANVFETVAFKMLEWLTPAAVEDMSRRARDFRSESESDDRDGVPTKHKSKLEHHSGSRQPISAQELPILPAGPNKGLTNGRAPPGHAQTERERGGSKDHQQSHEQLAGSRTASNRRNSNAKVRTSSGPKPKRQLSIDPYAQDAAVDDPYSGLLRSPRAAGGPTEKAVRVPKAAGSNLSRPISQLSSAGFFDDITLDKMPPPKTIDLKPRANRGQPDGRRSNEFESPKESTSASGTSSSRSCSNGSAGAIGQDSESEDESVLPQALSRLDAEVVDFICDVIQDDGTAEKHMLEPPSVLKFHNRQAGQGKLTRRKRHRTRGYPANLKQEWNLFVEQTLFYVLSDPQLVLRSFTKKGQLYDSQTLWYCMLRMTRVAPSLVYHSLWMAAASLFAPPKLLQSLRSPTAKLFPKTEASLSNLEAGRLLSICLHALIAAAPLVTDSQQLYDMSRIRSHGLSLAGSGAVARQPADLCLQYEDAFTDNLALRLARRLFAAITTRRYFDELSESTIGGGADKERDVLTPLFSQLDFLNMDAVYVLDFSFPDRALHETRVPILLLDWARTVMLNEWDGCPEVPGDGPFGGALALIEAMYKKRHELLLADTQFRSDYFAERLDTVQMPISWLSHTSTRQRLHLLDFPCLFSPSHLVSYFRSINFSRMSRSFEESTSIHDRIEVIADRTTLLPHHKAVITERLRAAAAKYLILNIRRGSVIEDAFDQLWRREERELLRPLKVHLGESNGEEGFDSGGVQQEFFRMAIAEAMNPDYGAFTVDERTRMAWFLPGSMEEEWKFELIGLLVSLAVYNGLTLPITFPKALYRKLLGEPVTELHHIADGWPDLASGLTTLLEWDEKDGLVEDVFARTYEFSVSALGEHITREMRPPPPNDHYHHNAAAHRRHGKEEAEEAWPQFPKTLSQSISSPSPQQGNPAEDEAPLVTSANRNAYVSDYIRYLTDVSVRPQYEAFARGFHTCLHSKSLTLLTPNLLQSVVEGVQEIDISELKRHARYVGWDASHRTVRDFWSVVKRYDEGMKRKLLEFVTASDRVPVGGVKNMMFIVQRNGEEDDPAGRLPTSYTCYGTLLLPEYKDKEMLRERLGMALENAQGFGFA